MQNCPIENEYSFTEKLLFLHNCSPNSHITIVIEYFQINISEAPSLLTHVIIFNGSITVKIKILRTTFGGKDRRRGKEFLENIQS